MVCKQAQTHTENRHRRRFTLKRDIENKRRILGKKLRLSGGFFFAFTPPKPKPKPKNIGK